MKFPPGGFVVARLMGHLFPGADQGCAYDHNGDGSGHGTQVDQQLSEAGEAAEDHAHDGQHDSGGTRDAVLVQLGKGLGQHTAFRHGRNSAGVKGDKKSFMSPPPLSEQCLYFSTALWRSMRPI